MRFLFVQFEIPNNKIHEFDLAFHRLVKWPLYTLYESDVKTNRKTFELTRQWDNKEDMQRELASREFINMLGMIKVLGKVLQSDIYNITNQEDLLQYMN